MRLILRILVACTIAMLVFAGLAAAWIWWGDWPATGPIGKPDDPELVVVLGGGNLARATVALQLAERFPDPPVVVTGDGGYQQAALRRGGLDPARIVVEPNATSTLENARLTAPWIGKAEGQIVLVTNDFHAPRALAVFRTTHPDRDFVVATEASARPFSDWQAEFRRRERAAAIYYLLRHRINSFRNRRTCLSTANTTPGTPIR